MIFKFTKAYKVSQEKDYIDVYQDAKVAGPNLVLAEIGLGSSVGWSS